jgi:hypothetical protein
MEEMMKKIIQGTMTREEVVRQGIEMYRDMFSRANRQVEVLRNVCFLPPPPPPPRTLFPRFFRGFTDGNIDFKKKSAKKYLEIEQPRERPP